MKSKIAKKQKEPVRLRFKTLNNGNQSVFLATYYNGKYTYEFLKMYIVPELTRLDVEANKETLRLAETIRAKRISEYYNKRAGFGTSLRFNETTLIEYLNHIRLKKSYKTSMTYTTLETHLLGFLGRKKDFRLKKVDKDFCVRFVSYLSKLSVCGNSIRKSSVNHYLNAFCALLNQATKDGYFERSPFFGVDRPVSEKSKREFLTIAEVKAFESVPCKNDLVKRAFLFSCFVGLRLSDVQSLRWSQILDNGRYKYVHVIQKKTNNAASIPLSNKACSFIDFENKTSEYVFHGLATTVRSDISYQLSLLSKKAGINKHVTFHTSRHTFAVMMLTLGTDIYTVSKLLGHTDIKTTQIYADIVDSKKNEAISKIDEAF